MSRKNRSRAPVLGPAKGPSSPASCRPQRPTCCSELLPLLSQHQESAFLFSADCDPEAPTKGLLQPTWVLTHLLGTTEGGGLGGWWSSPWGRGVKRADRPLEVPALMQGEQHKVATGTTLLCLKPCRGLPVGWGVPCLGSVTGVSPAHISQGGWEGGCRLTPWFGALQSWAGTAFGAEPGVGRRSRPCGSSAQKHSQPSNSNWRPGCEHDHLRQSRGQVAF